MQCSVLPPWLCPSLSEVALLAWGSVVSQAATPASCLLITATCQFVGFSTNLTNWQLRLNSWNRIKTRKWPIYCRRHALNSRIIRMYGKLWLLSLSQFCESRWDILVLVSVPLSESLRWSFSSWQSPLMSHQLFLRGLFVVDSEPYSEEEGVSLVFRPTWILAIHREISTCSEHRHESSKEVLFMWKTHKCHFTQCALFILVHKMCAQVQCLLYSVLLRNNVV